MESEKESAKGNSCQLEGKRCSNHAKNLKGPFGICPSPLKDWWRNYVSE
jgi:hypothetical protein